MKTQLLIAAACVASAGAFSASVSFQKKVERSRSIIHESDDDVRPMHTPHTADNWGVGSGCLGCALAAAHSQQLLLV